MSAFLVQLKRILSLKGSIAILLGISMLFLNGCDSLDKLLGKDDDGDSTPTSLFTVKFTNDFLPDDAESVVLLSDNDGSFLAMDYFVGNDSTTFPIPDSLSSVPDEISITNIYLYASGRIDLYTHLKVPTGASWTFGKDVPDYPEGQQELNIDFTNVPLNQRGRVTGPYNYGTWYPLNSGSALMYVNGGLPIDAYLLLTTDDGYLYDWKDNLNNFDNWDLSGLNAPSSRPFALNQTITEMMGVYQALYAYPNAGDRYNEEYELYDRYYSDTTLSSLNFHYPPGKFSDFSHYSVIYEDSEYQNRHIQWVFGDIPTEFSKIETALNFISSDPENFEISLSGSDFDQIYSYWVAIDEDPDGNDLSWRVYGPNDYTNFALPEIPSYLTSNPLLDRGSFQNVTTYVQDYSLDSYNDLKELSFQSPDLFYNVNDSYRASRFGNPQYYNQLNTLGQETIYVDQMNPENIKFDGDFIYQHYRSIKDRQSK